MHVCSQERACVATVCSVYMEVRGQFVGVGSFLPTMWGPGDGTHILRLGSKHPTNHLFSLDIHLLKPQVTHGC